MAVDLEIVDPSDFGIGDADNGIYDLEEGGDIFDDTENGIPREFVNENDRAMVGAIAQKIEELQIKPICLDAFGEQ
jgi:hypothetical protein